MIIKNLEIAGAAEIQINSFTDKRGSFNRLFCKDELRQYLNNKNIVNINLSKTLQKGCLRGLHFQNTPKKEIKIVKCLKGRIFDVLVDLRKGSKTFLQWYGTELSSKNDKILIIPEGCAHGFQALEDNSEIIYFVTNFYSPELEGGIRYNDPSIDIHWPLTPRLISPKDQKFNLLNDSFKGI